MLYICIVPNRGARIGHQTHEYFVLVNYCRKFGFVFVYHEFTCNSRVIGAALQFDKINTVKFTDDAIQSLKRISLRDIRSNYHETLLELHKKEESVLLYDHICGNEFFLGSLKYRPSRIEEEALHNEYSLFYKNMYPRQVDSAYICIHIRRGDILNMPSRYLNTMYFIDKYKYLLTKITDMNLPVYAVTENNFNDEILLKQHIPDVQIIKCDEVNAFYYLVHCNYLIASRSGFSNLAHFLGTMKIVVAPEWGFMAHNHI